jgi:hypothetical protein
MSFKQDNYAVIRGLLSNELAEVAKNYLETKRDVYHCLLEHRMTHPAAVHNYWYYNKDVVQNCYATYGDVLMDSLLLRVKPVIEQETGLELVETYSYTRIYYNGSELFRHKDRPACEVSLTMNLGGDPWDIFVEPSGETGKEGIRIALQPGDAVIYKGHLLEHWRERFEGEECYQTFFHYSDKNGPYGEDHKYDFRPMLGFPE